MISKGDLVLFQGDSITDNGRNRDIHIPNNTAATGCGYTGIIVSRLLSDRPKDGLRFLNRGVSGDRSVDLLSRWQLDTINLAPDILSILVGVNDTWHGFAFNNGVTVSRFEQVYRLLLQYSLEELPGIRFILCEPFCLQVGVVEPAWEKEVKLRAEVVRALADEFSARFVSFQSALDDRIDEAPMEYWLDDGVHPTPAGHAVLANCWLETVLGDE